MVEAFGVPFLAWSSVLLRDIWAGLGGATSFHLDNWIPAFHAGRKWMRHHNSQGFNDAVQSIYQSRTQNPQALWQAVSRQERLWEQISGDIEKIQIF